MTEAGDIQIVKERSVLLGAFCYLLNGWHVMPPLTCRDAFAPAMLDARKEYPDRGVTGLPHLRERPSFATYQQTDHF